jgi:hypothetical protein
MARNEVNEILCGVSIRALSGRKWCANRVAEECSLICAEINHQRVPLVAALYEMNIKLCGKRR